MSLHLAAGSRATVTPRATSGRKSMTTITSWGQAPCPQTCPHLGVPEDTPLTEWLKASQRDAFGGESQPRFTALTRLVWNACSKRTVAFVAFVAKRIRLGHRHLPRQACLQVPCARACQSHIRPLHRCRRFANLPCQRRALVVWLPLAALPHISKSLLRTNL